MIGNDNDVDVDQPKMISELAASAVVNDNEEGKEVKAVDVEEARGGSRSHRRRSLIVCGLLIIGGVIIGLAVGLSSTGGNNNVNNNTALDGTNKEEDESGANNENETPSQITTSSPTEAPISSSYYPTVTTEEGGGAGSVYPDDGTCTSNSNSSMVATNFELSSCTYIENQTVYVVAPALFVPNNNATTGSGVVLVEKKLSGGNSAFDGSNAIVVSYSSDGTAGAVWILGYNSSNNNNTDSQQQQQQQGRWEQTGILQTEYEDQLGWSVAIKGITLVVGAPGFQGREVPLQSDGWYWSGRGNAIVMTKNNGNDDDDDDGGDVWVRQHVLVPEVAEDTAGFGNSVDIAECECLIAVGAWHDRDSRGSAYVFEKSSSTNGTWVEIQKLAFNDTRRSQSGTLHGNYGYNVALSDDYLAVKAPYDSYVGSYDYEDVNRGVTYVYKRGSNGLYEQISRLCTPEGRQVGGFFKDLIFLNDFLLVGAPGKNTVYVFKELDSSSGFVKTAELKLNNEELDNESSFGIRLDGRGTHVMVGDLGGKKSYIFAFENGVWKQKSSIDSVDTASSGTSIVKYTPDSFEVDGEQYGGEVSFNELVCER